MAAWVLVCGVAIAGGRLSDGLLFYAPMDRDPAVAAVATGLDRGKAEGFVRVAGPAGRAIRAGESGVRFPMLGNFEHTRGSLVLWAKIEKPGGKPVALLDATNFALRWDPAQNLLIFMTGTTLPGKGFQWNYGCSAKPPGKFGDWVQVAATWDAEEGVRSLYFDGQPVSTTRSEWMRRTMGGESAEIRLAAGADAQVSLGGFAVWNRVLSPAEIRGVFEDPASLASAAAGVPARATDGPALRFGLADGSAAPSIVAPETPYAFEFPVANSTAAEWSGDVRLRLLDFHEREIDSASKAVSVPASGAATVAHAFRAANPGIYKVEASVADPEVLADVASFVVWPEDAALSDDSFFGVHVNSWNEDYVAQAARLGFRWNRNHNMLQTTWWPRVQPEPGAFQWLHDPALELNEKHGFRVMGQFFGTPYWAAAGGPLQPQKVTAQDSPYPYGALPDFDLWREYVRQTVRRYKDRIRLWETGNEPDVSRFFNGTPEQFAELAKITYETVKAEDPEATVMLAGFAPGWPWVRRTAEAGAFQAADAISLHLYHPADGDMEEFAERVAASVAFYRELIAEHGRSPDMPLWQTEGGSGSSTWLRGIHLDHWPPADVLPERNWREAAINQIKSEVIIQSHGFEKSFSYYWNPGKSFSHLRELDINGTPKPKVVARAALAKVVDGAGFHGWVDRDEARSRFAIYGRPGGSAVVAWAADGGEATLGTAVFGEDAAYQNLMGAPMEPGPRIQISEEPIFVRSGLDASEMAAALGSAALEEIRTPPAREAESDENPHGVPVLPAFASAVEGVENLFAVDLRPHTNMAFADGAAGDGKGGWSDEGDINDLRTMPLGRQEFYGVPFDIIDPVENGGTSVVTLRGTAVTGGHPERVENIRVDRAKVRSLFFLHSAAWSQGDVPIGSYRIHYADGSSVEVPITPRANTGDWWSPHTETEESRSVPIRIDPVTQRDTGWRYLRVWEWQNPNPDVPIDRIDFVSAGGTATPILVGISGVTW